MKFPIFVDGDLTLNEVAAVFAQAGYALRSDPAGRMVASRIPSFLKRDDNVVRLPQRTIKR